MKAGDVFKTNNHGECTVVEYNGCFSVKVVFSNTGTEHVTSSDQLRLGKVKDRYAKTLCGVGYLGEKLPYIESIHTCWANMIKRCYDKEVQAKHPTYIGCSVCDEWLCFSNFYVWYVSNYKQGYEIDKDKKVPGNKVYSPDLCSFIISEENIQLAHQKMYQLRNKDGRVEIVENMTKFCRDNGLSNSNMHSVRNGKRKSHNGWIEVKLINK